MGDLIRLTHGVWREARAADDFAFRCESVLTALPVGSVLSGPTPALLRGTWLPRRFENLVEVTVPAEPERLPRCWPGSRREEVRLRRRALPGRDAEFLDGLPVTTPARTWVDLADRLQPAELVAAGDWTVRWGCSFEQLAIQVSRAIRQRGVRRARTILPLLSDRADSRPESHLRAAVVLSSLRTPSIEVNQDVFDSSGQWIGRPDLLLRDWHIALEYQGADHADPDRMRRDMTRWGDFGREHWDMLLFGPAEVFAHPERIPTLIRATRARRRRTA